MSGSTTLARTYARVECRVHANIANRSTLCVRTCTSLIDHHTRAHAYSHLHARTRTVLAGNSASLAASEHQVARYLYCKAQITFFNQLYKYTLQLLLIGAYSTSVCIDNNRDNCALCQAIIDFVKFQYCPSLFSIHTTTWLTPPRMVTHSQHNITMIAVHCNQSQTYWIKGEKRPWSKKTVASQF